MTHASTSFDRGPVVLEILAQREPSPLYKKRNIFERFFNNDDPKVTGAQVCMAAVRHPVEDYVVLRHLGTGELESLRPTETSDLDKNKVSRFFVVKGADTHRFFVEGLAMEWSNKKLIASQIKFLAGAGDDQALSLEGPGVDQVFEDDDDVDIGGGGVERFKLRHRKTTVTVIELLPV